MSKITEMAAGTTPLTGGELVEVVDTADTSMAPSGTNKQVTAQDIADLVDVEEAPIDGKQYGREDAGWTEIVASGGGGSAAAVGPLTAVRVQQTVAQSLNASVVMAFQTVTSETGDAMFSALEPTRLTAPAAGWYTFIATAANTRGSSAAGAQSLDIKQYDSAGTQKDIQRAADAQTWSTGTVTTALFYMEEGDYVTSTHYLGTADNTVPAYTTFSGYLSQQPYVGTADSETITVKQEVPVVLSGGTLTADLSSYTSGDRLIIEGSMSSSADPAMVINGDTGANYHGRYMYGAGSAVYSEEGSNALVSQASTVPGYFTLAINNPFDAVVHWAECSSSAGLSTSSGPNVINYSKIHNVAARIDTIAITDILTADVRCYIEKQGVLPMVEYSDVTLDMPVVQAMSCDHLGSITWMNEAGWTVTRTGTGVYDVTFPSSATDAATQSIVATADSGGDGAAAVNVVIHSRTASGCTIKTRFSADDSAVDYLFAIHRRLPDQEVIAGGILNSDVTLDMPVVQSATFGESGVVDSSNEDGWSIVKNSTGQYTVTFPTAAGGVNDQWLAATVTRTGGATSASVNASIAAQTATSCVVQTKFSSSETVVDRAFTLVRRLPDQEVIAGGVLKTDTYDFDMPVVQSACIDTSAGAVHWSSEAGWSAANVGTGVVDVTFPTAVGDKTLQSIQVSIDGVNNANNLFTRLINVTGTGCRVEVFADTGSTHLDRDIYITRRLPDREVVAGGVLKTEGKHVIESITDPVSGEFDFQGIPQKYRRVWLEGNIKDLSTNDWSNAARLTMNGDVTDANYTQIHNWVNGANHNASTSSNREISRATRTTDADNYTQVSIVLEGYSGSHHKMAQSTFSGREKLTEFMAGTAALHHNSLTAAVTSLLLDSTTGLKGTLTLYGEY